MLFRIHKSIMKSQTDLNISQSCLKEMQIRFVTYHELVQIDNLLESLLLF